MVSYLYNLEHLKNLKIKLTKNLNLVNKLVGQAQPNNIRFRFDVYYIIDLIIIYSYLFYYI